MRNFFLCLGIWLLSPFGNAATITVSSTAETITEDAWLKDPTQAVSLSAALRILAGNSLRRNNGELEEQVLIKLAAGIYRLDDPILIDRAMSGTKDAGVRIEGAGDKTILMGSKALAGFKPLSEGQSLDRLPAASRAHVLQASVEELDVNLETPRSPRGFRHPIRPSPAELFYKGTPQVLARWPNEEYSLLRAVTSSSNGNAFFTKGAALNKLQMEEDLWVTGYWYHDWADETLRVRSVNPRTGQIEIGPVASRYGMKNGQRYRIINALSELDSPGEWYLDRQTKTVFFWPPDKQSLSDVEFGHLENIIKFDKASFVTVTKMTVQGALGDAITSNQGRYITLDDLTVKGAGNRGVYMSGEYSGIRNSRVFDTGEGGISLSGGNRETLRAGKLFAVGNEIYKFNHNVKAYRPGVSVYGVGNIVSENLIHTASHSAVIFNGNDHLISKNEIHNVALETGDTGAIYTGRDWTARGTKIEDNYFHNIPYNFDYGKVKAIYLDDQASGISVSGNIFYRVGQGIFIGGGRDNSIAGNFFFDSVEGIHLDARGRTWQKGMVADMNGPLRVALKKYRVQNPPYSTAYPLLAEVDPSLLGAPGGNLAINNFFADTVPFDILPEATSGIRLENNIVSKKKSGDLIGPITDCTSISNFDIAEKLALQFKVRQPEFDEMNHIMRTARSACTDRGL